MDLNKFYGAANAYRNAPEDDDVKNGGSAGYLTIIRNEFLAEVEKLVEAERLDDITLMNIIAELPEDRQTHVLTHIVKVAPVGDYLARKATDELDRIYDKHNDLDSLTM